MPNQRLSSKNNHTNIPPAENAKNHDYINMLFARKAAKKAKNKVCHLASLPECDESDESDKCDYLETLDDPYPLLPTKKLRSAEDESDDSGDESDPELPPHPPWLTERSFSTGSNDDAAAKLESEIEQSFTPEQHEAYEALIYKTQPFATRHSKCDYVNEPPTKDESHSRAEVKKLPSKGHELVKGRPESESSMPKKNNTRCYDSDESNDFIVFDEDTENSYLTQQPPPLLLSTKKRPKPKSSVSSTESCDQSPSKKKSFFRLLKFFNSKKTNKKPSKTKQLLLSNENEATTRRNTDSRTIIVRSLTPGGGQQVADKRLMASTANTLPFFLNQRRLSEPTPPLPSRKTEPAQIPIAGSDAMVKAVIRNLQIQEGIRIHFYLVAGKSKANGDCCYDSLIQELKHIGGPFDRLDLTVENLRSACADAYRQGKRLAGASGEIRRFVDRQNLNTLISVCAYHSKYTRSRHVDQEALDKLIAERFDSPQKNAEFMRFVDEQISSTLVKCPDGSTKSTADPHQIADMRARLDDYPNAITKGSWGSLIEYVILCNLYHVEPYNLSSIVVSEVIPNPENQKQYSSAFYVANKENYRAVHGRELGTLLCTPEVPLLIVEQLSKHFVPLHRIEFPEMSVANNRVRSSSLTLHKTPEGENQACSSLLTLRI